jgi:hypothetical protein
VSFSTAAKTRLTHHDLGRFPGDSLFDRLARAVCEAGCLPRKELYEAWEVARRVRRRVRGGRVVDVAGGHGLLAFALLLLDDTSPEAWVVDPASPRSAESLGAPIAAAWPRLAGRVHRAPMSIDDFPLEANDVVASVHACGADQPADGLVRGGDVGGPGIGRFVPAHRPLQRDVLSDRALDRPWHQRRPGVVQVEALDAPGCVGTPLLQTCVHVP